MMPGSLSPAERVTLDHLKRLGYATQSQLEYWGNYSQTAMSLALSSLCERKFVQVEKKVRPNIWNLTWAGARVVDKPLSWNIRKPSWSVMAHTVRRNQCEIILREQHPDFRFLDKASLFRIGLNPSHGEHAGVQDGKIVFVLLDDYLMGSNRISNTLSRRHRLNEKYCDLKISVNWSMIFKRFVLASTNPSQIKRHERFLQRKGLEAELLYVPPIWAY